ncbi:MAG: Hpt domain-containing protein, partial [Gammaproteobacteria bacterium]
MPETEADELPVLSADADPEIVEIYLEEAAEELEALSRTVPAWLDNPADRDTLEAVRRSFHTLKGSGRMAGAMRAGEFSWSIESLLNKVLDGSVDPDGAVCELLGQVLEPLAQIIRQIGGGPAPDVDVQALLKYAVALASGNRAEPGGNIPGEDAVSESEPIESEPIEAGPVEAEPIEAGEIEAEPIDAELIDIFVTECRDLLQLVKDYLAADTAGGVVTEPVYRALHTIAGISETAGATSINLLATDLYSYFDGIYQSHLPVDAGALKVLDECTGAIDCMLVNATALEIDTQRLSALRASIASLPPVTGELPAVVQVTEATGADPAEDIQKPAETHPEAGVMPVAAGAPVVDHDLDEDPYADMDPELVEIFIEEASEILDSSENILRNWTADPHSNGHLDELQRQLHTLKGGARMVNIVAIGDLSHALETLLTQVAEARISTSESLFSLLTDVHDGLAGMLEQVRKRQLPAAAVELMAALGGFGQQDAADPDAVADVA